jgi:hypothetical protein
MLNPFQVFYEAGDFYSFDEALSFAEAKSK